MRVEHLNAVIAAIYDAAASDPPASDAWVAVARLIEKMSGGACVLSLEDTDGGTAKLAAAPSMTEDFRRAYETLHAGQSPFVRSLSRRPHPAVVTDTEADADAGAAGSVRTSPFYRDWMQPQRFRHMIASDVLRDGADMVVLKTLLPPETPPSEAHVRLHVQLQPHLCRAAALLRLDQYRRAALHAAEVALQGLSVAVLLARTRDANVTFMNSAASALVAERDGIMLDGNGRIAATDTASTARLRRLIASQENATAATSGALRLSRPSGAPDLHLLVTRSRGADGSGLAAPTASIFVTDPSHPPHLSHERLRALHGLTAAEARVTAAVARGASITETARELGVAQATARHHLKQAFAKTGTHRQADLVRLILANPLMHDGRQN